MSGLTGGSATWALIVIVLIPAAIVAAAELDERLRQRESFLRRAVITIRTWGLPFFAIWALLVPVLGVDSDSIAVRLVTSGLVLSAAAAVLGLLRIIVDDVRRRAAADERRRAPELLLALPRIAAIVVTGWLLIDSVWGVDLSAALTALGVTSLVVSFALQDTLSGLASGILLLGDQPFKPGDWIRSGDLEGQVVDINWRTSRLRDRNGDMLIVPNSQLAGSSVMNFTSPEPMHRVVVELQVAYVNPPTIAKAMLLDAAAGTPGVRSDPPPNVRVVSIDDPLMGYAVDMWIDDFAIEPRVRSDFGSLVWYHSHRHGVPLPSPAQDLFLHDAATTPGDRDFTVGELRSRAERSPLLASLPDDELDKLASSARPLRFAAGERIVDSLVQSNELLVLVEGRAELVLIEPGLSDVIIAELTAGEIIGPLIGETNDGNLVARAVTDCEFLGVDGELASEISSQHPDVAGALNRTAAIRRRRVERIVERRGQLDDPLIGDVL